MRSIAGFLALAYGLTWIFVAIAFAVGVRSVADPRFVIVAAISMLFPALSAIIQHRLRDKGAWPALGLRLKGTRWPVLLATCLVGLLIVPICLLVIQLGGSVAGVDEFGQVSVTSERLGQALQEIRERAGSHGAPLVIPLPGGLILAGMLLAALVAAFTINLPFMLGEELGWRGLLYHHTRHWKGLRRVLFTGVVWGFWHAPLIAMGHNYPQYPVAGIFIMVLFTTLLSFLFDWSRARSGSIWSSCVLHGMINGGVGAMLFAWGGHPLVGNIVGAAGMITLILLVLLVLAFDPAYRRMLGEEQAAAQAGVASPAIQ